MEEPIGAEAVCASALVLKDSTSAFCLLGQASAFRSAEGTQPSFSLLSSHEVEDDARFSDLGSSEGKMVAPALAELERAAVVVDEPEVCRRSYLSAKQISSTTGLWQPDQGRCHMFLGCFSAASTTRSSL